jgi:hypothetical protein
MSKQDSRHANFLILLLFSFALNMGERSILYLLHFLQRITRHRFSTFLLRTVAFTKPLPPIRDVTAWYAKSSNSLAERTLRTQLGVGLTSPLSTHDMVCSLKRFIQQELIRSGIEQNPGPPKTRLWHQEAEARPCTICNAPYHNAKECDKKCASCQAVTHAFRECPGAHCTECNQQGHWSTWCPTSARAKPTHKKVRETSTDRIITRQDQHITGEVATDQQPEEFYTSADAPTYDRARGGIQLVSIDPEHNTNRYSQEAQHLRLEARLSDRSNQPVLHGRDSVETNSPPITPKRLAEGKKGTTEHQHPKDQKPETPNRKDSTTPQQTKAKNKDDLGLQPPEIMEIVRMWNKGQKFKLSWRYRDSEEITIENGVFMTRRRAKGEYFTARFDNAPEITQHIPSGNTDVVVVSLVACPLTGTTTQNNGSRLR